MTAVVTRLVRSPTRTMTAFGALFAVVIVGAFLLDLWMRHRAAIDAAEESARNYSEVLAEHTARTFEGVDRVLAEAAAIRQRYMDGRYATDISVTEALRHLQKSSPLVMAIGWTNAVGELEVDADAGAALRSSLSDLAYFNAHRTNSGQGLIIAPPFPSIATGHWITAASRRLANVDGSFAGIVSVVLDPSYFASVYRSIKLGQHGSVMLLHRDGGMILAREPSVDSAIGKSFAAGPLMTDYLPRAPGGSYHTISIVDGVDRIAGYRAVSGLPLVVLVTYSRADVLDAWSRHALAFAPLVALVVVMVLVGTGLLIRQARNLAHKTKILTITLDNIPHGLCMLDANARLTVCNNRYAEMYGLSSAQTKPGTSIREVLEARIASGNSPEVAEDYIAKRLQEITRTEPYHVTDQLRDGRFISVTHQPLAGGGSVAIHQDVTDQKLLEAELIKSATALKDSNSRFNAAVQSMSQGLCMFDAAQKVVIANERYRKIYGLPEELAKPGTPLSCILEYRASNGTFRGPALAEYLRCSLDRPSEIQELGNGRVVQILRHKLADGSWLTTHEDITERRRSEIRVSFMALHDSLTGLFNRAALVEKIADACARYRRRGEAFNVFMLDLDRFKQVNDTFGHPAGDDLLQQVAQRLKSTLRETDVLARLGGDEFAIIQASDGSPREAAESLANRIIRLIADPFLIEGNDVTIGTSIGIAFAPEHSVDADDLIKLADLALYETKSRGRNAFTCYEPALSERVTARHTLEGDLRRAILQHQLEVHYQPVFDLKSGAICCAEALVRWRHPTKGLISPDQFIPLAEETGLIAQIGEFVLQTACSDATSWPAATKVAVNLSTLQLRSPRLLDVVMFVLVQCGLPPERLELEITETALIESGAECLAMLRQFKRLGITIALDDFGTGYSSLSQLSMFAFDKIKIDKSFTQNLIKRADCRAVVSAVLALAHSLDIATTAEGVETEQQLKLLAAAGVSSVQGFLIKKPGPAAELDFDMRLELQEVGNAA
jgi:diguanylate cyclase (GGDEF)-like protein